MPKLAARVGRAKPSAIMQVAEKAKQLKAEGRDIISFSIGVPNFLPGEHVYQAVGEWLSRDSGQYGSNRGDARLLDAFLAHMGTLGLDGYTRENCAVAVGAKHILYNLFEAIVDEGDEVAFPTPYWTSYVDIAEIVGAKVKLLPCPPEQDYKMTPAQLDEALASKPALFLFNNPSNPTGMVYTKDEIAALADVLAGHPETWIITDDIYNKMVFDGVGYHNFVNARPELRDRVIFVDSLSKTHGMPGWRVGLMAGPESIARAVVTLNSNHITNIPARSSRPSATRSWTCSARSRAWSAPSRRAPSTSSPTSAPSSASRTTAPC
jgi:aspartate aminotransferase